MRKAVIAAALMVFAISLSAQTAAQNGHPGKNRARHADRGTPGYANGAVAFPVGRLRAQLARNIEEAKTKGSVARVLENFDSYRTMLWVLGRSSGADVDAHWDEIVLAEQGGATLVTGGRVIDGQTDANGETHGMRIEGGRFQSVGAGDIVTIQAGTPHQMLLPPGTVFSAFVIQVREP